jgi:hypothetical protein
MVYPSQDNNLPVYGNFCTHSLAQMVGNVLLIEIDDEKSGTHINRRTEKNFFLPTNFHNENSFT